MLSNMAIVFSDDFNNTTGSDITIQSWPAADATSKWLGHASPATAFTVSFADDCAMITTDHYAPPNTVNPTDSLEHSYVVINTTNYPAAAVDDYRVTCRFREWNVFSSGLCLARMQPGAASGYVLEVKAATITLYKMTAGVLVSLDSQPIVVNGSGYIECVGDQISWGYDTGSFGLNEFVALRTVTDATFPTGVAGFGIKSWSLFGLPTAAQNSIDDFSLDELGLSEEEVEPVVAANKNMGWNLAVFVGHTHNDVTEDDQETYTTWTRAEDGTVIKYNK